MTINMLLHTFLGLLLVAIPAGALYLLERKMLKPFVVSVVRMVVQLLAICLMVWALIKINRAWFLVVWLLVMAVNSGWLVMRRCKLDAPRLMVAGSVGLFVGVLAVGLWLLALVLPVRVFDARWFVPVTALLMAHATTMMIRGMNTYVSALKADEQQYEFLRGNGLSHMKALQPFLRRSLLAVTSPTIANLSVLGLTSMPLLLGGIFLGGMTPINAFALMLHMTVGCVAASVLSLGVTLFVADKFLFDKFGKLQH